MNAFVNVRPNNIALFSEKFIGTVAFKSELLLYKMSFKNT